MIRFSASIGIGITTKNRWKDLAVTLARLRDEGLDRLETIVIDDGSDEPAPPELARDFPWVKFERFEQSEGVSARRNRLAALLTTEFYLSIDDDSFPVAGDLEAAANWLKDRPKVAALAFRVLWADQPVPTDIDPLVPVLVKDFVGCGALLRRDLFLKLGGFDPLLHFYHEEYEYSCRAFMAGYDNYAYRDMIIRHMVTFAARPRAERARFFVRNFVLFDLWYYPDPISWVMAFVHLPLLMFFVPTMRQFWREMIGGWIEAFRRYPAWRNLKSRLSWTQYGEWQKRPFAFFVCQSVRKR